MCNGCAMNFALSELGKTRKKFVFLGKGMVRPGGFELPTFWFVARRLTHFFWLTQIDNSLHSLPLAVLSFQAVIPGD